MNKTKVLAALTGLSQESRLDIVRLLVERGPGGMPAGEIATHLDLPNATLSFHLKELSHAGLVASRQTGRFIYYSARFDTVNGLVDYLTHNCCRGTSRADECASPTQRRRKVS